MKVAKDYVGWFDTPDQSEPTHEPLKLCIACDEALTPDNVRTISMMRADEPFPRSYFYRAHKTCIEAAPTNVLDAIAWDLIDAEKREVAF